MKEYILQDNDKIALMNVAMVSEYLHVTKSTIYKWVRSGFIPHKKLGKPLLFIKRDIDEWVENDGVIKNDLPELPKSIKSNDDGEIPLRA